MPWHVENNHGECPSGKPYAVVKDATGEVEGCHASKDDANAQVRALYASEEDMGIIRDALMGDVEDYELFGEKYPPKEEQEKIKRKGRVRSIKEASSMGTTSNGGGAYTTNVSFAVEAEVEDVEATELMWESIIAVEGYATNDGRYLMPGEISERDLPLPLMSQTVTAEGHMGAEIAGRIDKVWRQPNTELGDDAVEVWARGVFDTGEAGQEAARLVEAQTLRGVSIDMDVTEVLALDPETLEELDPEEMSFEDLFFGGGFIAGMKGKIMGATITPFPAIEHASISILSVGDHKVVVASAFGITLIKPEALTAAAKGMAPLKPPKEWFFQAEADKPTPLTVTSDGRVFGHLAPWGSCHVGISGVCKMAPHSNTGYAYYHLGQIEADDGQLVSVGKVTVDTDHASTSPGLTAADVRAHYDDTGTVGAYVRAKDGRYGIWLSGCVRSDAPATVVRDMRANPPSGDWRSENSSLELQAALCVVVPGFPIPRYEAVMVASGADDEQITAMIQTGFMPEPVGEKAALRKIAVLSQRAKKALVG